LTIDWFSARIFAGGYDLPLAPQWGTVNVSSVPVVLLPEQTRQQRKLWPLGFVQAKDKHMRDFREAKAMAQSLRAALAAMGFRISVSQSLELIAQSFGLADWNTLAAAIRTQATAAPETVAPPAPSAEYTKTGSRLTSQLQSTLNQAFAYARERRHELVTVEHLLLLLLADPDASRVITVCGVDLSALREKLTRYIDHEMKIHTTDGGEKPQPTLAFQRILQRAVFHVQQAGRPQVGSLDVLVAMFSEKLSHAVKVLNEQGMSRLDAVNYITHGLTKDGGRAAPDSPVAT
jgi:hypothetical protein